MAIDKRIGSAGQPAAGQFALVQEAGYRVVINLALPSSDQAMPDEGAQVTGLGLVYVHIPVDWEAPALVDYQQFAAVMQAFQGERVFIHCVRNMRVSCFMYLNRILAMGIEPEVAMVELHKVWDPNDVWMAFIDSVLFHYRG